MKSSFIRMSFICRFDTSLMQVFNLSSYFDPACFLNEDQIDSDFEEKLNFSLFLSGQLQQNISSWRSQVEVPWILAPPQQKISQFSKGRWSIFT